MQWGAVYGHGWGLEGQTFAIPTKDIDIRTMYLDGIKGWVEFFYEYVFSAKADFLVTRIGCGLAAYTDEDIAPMFKSFLNIPNVYLPIEWREILTGENK